VRPENGNARRFEPQLHRKAHLHVFLLACPTQSAANLSFAQHFFNSLLDGTSIATRFLVIVILNVLGVTVIYACGKRTTRDIAE
jgi:hypothetical protein